MKKKLAMVLAAAMTLSMAACGSAGSNDTTTTGSQANTDGTKAETKGEESKVKTVSEGKLIVGTEAGFAPYEYMVGTDVVGVDMDIAQAIADELGLTLEVQNMDFDGALAAVQEGKVDLVLAGVSISGERAELMDFSDYYVDSTEVVVVNAANPALSTPTGEALNGMTIGVQQGNIADIWVSNTENTEPKDIIRYTKFAQAGVDLKNGKIDCIVMDELPAKELVESSEGALMILEGEALFEDQYAVALQKGNTDLTEVVNKVIGDLKASGEMDKIIEKHSGAK